MAAETKRVQAKARKALQDAMQRWGVSIEELSRDTMGKVASETRAAISKTGDSAEKAWLSVAADALVAVVRPRNSVLHARPASSSSGHQTLFRFAAARGKESHESHEITETFLLDLKALACEHITKVNTVRLS